MDPRREAPRVGFRRIDAALDSLRPMGFPESKISRTIRNLLRSYGGEDGWPFIEEGSYKLVIDTMIEEQEQENDEDEDDEDEAGDGSSSVKDDDEEEDDDDEEEVEEHDSSSQHVMEVEALPTYPPPCIDTPSSMEGDAPHEKLKVQDTQVQSRPTCSLPNKPRPLRNAAPQDKLCLTPDVPRPSRRPCYGWISSDDEEDDLVYSEQAR